jgi:hypothetical protein
MVSIKGGYALALDVLLAFVNDDLTVNRCEGSQLNHPKQTPIS